MQEVIQHITVEVIANNIGVWLAALFAGVLTVFSDKILERIRFRLNRADLRGKQFEAMALDFSSYVFWVEVYQERFARNWIEEDDLQSVAGELNGAMVTLRTKEYVYWSWVKKYWGEQATHQFAAVMEIVKSVDLLTHDFNDPAGWAKKAETLGHGLAKLRAALHKFLTTGLETE